MTQHRLRSIAAAVLLATIAFAFVACGDDDDDGRSPTATATSTSSISTASAAPTRTATAAPSPTTAVDLGRQVADAVVRAVRERDYQTLVGLIRFTSVRCIDSPQGIGAPPLCSQAGVPSGTIVDVLPSAFCEGEYILRQNIIGALAARFEGQALESYGLLRPTRHPMLPPADPPADYAPVFSSQRVPNFYLAVHVDDARIVALQSMGICGPQVPPRTDPSWVVPPAS